MTQAFQPVQSERWFACYTMVIGTSAWLRTLLRFTVLQTGSFFHASKSFASISFANYWNNRAQASSLKLSNWPTFYDLAELFQACIPVVKTNLTELEAHDDWSFLKELGVVEKVLKACNNEDFEPLEDIDSPLNRSNKNWLKKKRIREMSHDFKSIYLAVVDGDRGFAADMVKMVNNE